MVNRQEQESLCLQDSVRSGRGTHICCGSSQFSCLFCPEEGWICTVHLSRKFHICDCL